MTLEGLLSLQRGSFPLKILHRCNVDMSAARKKEREEFSPRKAPPVRYAGRTSRLRQLPDTRGSSVPSSLSRRPSISPIRSLMLFRSRRRS